VIVLVSIALAIFVVPEPWKIPVVVLGVLIELGETAVEVWWSRRRRPKVGPETVIGAVGIVSAPCHPDGQVRVGGEVWLARCEPGADQGERVRVVARDGLTLVVEPVAASEEP
jgi:membrane-bound serine protease (ClpP class)